MRSTIWLEFCAAGVRNPELRAEMAKIYEAWRQPFATAINEGIAAGIFHPLIPPDHIVDLLLMTMDGTQTASAVKEHGISNLYSCEIMLQQARALLGVNLVS